MGEEPHGIRCEDIDDTKWYVCECQAFDNGNGVTGCNRPYVGTDHDIVTGAHLKAWVCGDLDCTDGWTLIWFWGTAQRLLKAFGPYDDMEAAQAANW